MVAETVVAPFPPEATWKVHKLVRKYMMTCSMTVSQVEDWQWFFSFSISFTRATAKKQKKNYTNDGTSVTKLAT